MNILVIGDCHITDGQDLSRFNLLSKLIIERKPNIIVQIGDFLTLNCLSAWDKNKRKRMEGRRYKAELITGNEALDRILFEINLYNIRQKINKKAQYKPKWIFLEGNHEERLERYLEYDPTFDGLVSIENDLLLKKRKMDYEYIRYPGCWYYKNIDFTHIPFNKSRAIGGINIARKAEFVSVNSTVFGHTHTFDIGNAKRKGQDYLQQIVCVGCFFEEVEDYMKGRMENYWRGVVMLDVEDDNNFNIETISLDKMKRVYK